MKLRELMTSMINCSKYSENIVKCWVIHVFIEQNVWPTPHPLFDALLYPPWKKQDQVWIPLENGS